MNNRTEELKNIKGTLYFLLASISGTIGIIYNNPNIFQGINI